MKKEGWAETFQTYQRVVYRGYVWFDKIMYYMYMECEIKLHTDQITYRWNE